MPDTTSTTYLDFAGKGNWEPRVLIDSVALPKDGIEVGSVAVNYTIQVRLSSGLQWGIKKRYSEIRKFHKSIGARVKHLRFPAKHFVRNCKIHVLQQRRQELAVYFCELLAIRPFLIRELYNFLGVYVNIKSFERDGRKKSILSSSGLSQTTISEESYEDQENSSVVEVVESAPAPLGNLIELCFHMGGAVSMSENVLKRLFITRNRLVQLRHAGTIAPNDAKGAFGHLTARFDQFLTRNANRWAIVDATSLVRHLYGFHCELDILQRHVGLVKCKWEVAWVNAVQVMDEKLVATGRPKCGCVCAKLPHETTCGLATESADRDTAAVSPLVRVVDPDLPHK
ncbi:PX domain-containing protein [Phytophthora infestans]|uniref:PX domain-containing protein n=1 Tax=Phytophthora infestans TaxID=4787 RepID=A0A8S9V6S2_PHYIN|nr:PX domain-containing protein [Phytophthora infestans]KAF4146218.1 PX domain-containing protein [Phytophthora infestans]KAF4146988.1 PX domain-containing protein [Phytophthora infestans]